MAFDAINTEQGLAMQAFIRLYNEAPFELINGERVPLVPGVAIHGKTIRAIMRVLDGFAQAHDAGQAFSEMPFVLEDKTDWVSGSRVPDVMFFVQERFQTYTKRVPDWEQKPFVLVPDIAIEVVSPNDKFSAVTRKVDRYLKDGVRLVWVVDPQQAQVIVYRHDSRTLLWLDATDRLTAEGTLPEFETDVAAFFTL